MNTETLIDFLLHVLFSSFTFYSIYRKWGQYASALLGAIIGGILIDSDHLIDYFFAYGTHFNFTTFINGHEFLVSNKIHIVFHAWEYVIGIILIVLFLDKKRVGIRVFLLALATSMLFHLMIDTVLHKNHIKMYSVLYRTSVNFDLDRISTPEQIVRQNELRKQFKLEKHGKY